MFVFDPVKATVEKILASGDMLEVAPGDVREVAEDVALLGGSGNEDGRPTGFNDEGRAALRVLFTDGLGIIVATSADQAIKDLIGAVEVEGLPGGLENRLTKSLRNAQGSVARGRIGAAIGRIGAFINQVEAQLGKRIPKATANALIDDAETLLDALGDGPTAAADG